MNACGYTADEKLEVKKNNGQQPEVAAAYMDALLQYEAQVEGSEKRLNQKQVARPKIASHSQSIAIVGDEVLGNFWPEWLHKQHFPDKDMPADKA